MTLPTTRATTTPTMARKPRSDDSRRKPRRRTYKKRDEDASADAGGEADGVMKTLSRGRRKASEEGAEASAETTD